MKAPLLIKIKGMNSVFSCIGPKGWGGTQGSDMKRAHRGGPLRPFWGVRLFLILVLLVRLVPGLILSGLLLALFLTGFALVLLASDLLLSR